MRSSLLVIKRWRGSAPAVGGAARFSHGIGAPARGSCPVLGAPGASFARATVEPRHAIKRDARRSLGLPLRQERCVTRRRFRRSEGAKRRGDGMQEQAATLRPDNPPGGPRSRRGRGRPGEGVAPGTPANRRLHLPRRDASPSRGRSSRSGLQDGAGARRVSAVELTLADVRGRATPGARSEALVERTGSDSWQEQGHRRQDDDVPPRFFRGSAARIALTVASMLRCGQGVKGETGWSRTTRDPCAPRARS